MGPLDQLDQSELTTLSSNQGHQPRRDKSIPCMGVWQIYKDTEQSQEKETLE